MATVEVYPPEGETYPDAEGVPITSAGAIVDASKYIKDAIKRGFLLTWDPLDVYDPGNRTGTRGKAPADAAYVTMSLDSSLSNKRRIVAGSGITLTDGGANGTLTIAVAGGGSGPSAGFQTQAALEAASIDASIDAIQVLGHTEAGDGGGGLFKRITSNFPPEFATGVRPGLLTAADGSRWVYVPDERGINARVFGALGDGLSTPSQNCRGINAALYFDTAYAFKGAVYIPAGTYTVNDTIHICYGVANFSQTSLEGDGRKFNANQSFSGTSIVATASDRPCISIQGGRAIRVLDLDIRGPNAAYLEDSFLGFFQFDPPVDDLVLANWIGPTMHANFNARYAPCAAITIDGYSGTRPGTSYPDVTYPAGMGAVSQYGKTGTSTVDIHNVSAAGFCVPVALAPCDLDSQGDFISIKDCQFSYNVYGVISVGNSQARTTQCVNVNAAMFHTGATNSVHGRRSGKIGCEWINCNLGVCIQWFEFTNASFAGPMKFRGCYAEQVWRLGSYGTVANGNAPLEFDSCVFDMINQTNAVRGNPITIMDAPSTNVSFRNCVFVSYVSTLAIKAKPEFCSVENCSFEVYGDRANMYEKIAHNFTAGGLMFTVAAAGRPHRPARFSAKPNEQYDPDSGATLDSINLVSPLACSRTRLVPAWIDRVCSSETPSHVLDVPPLWSVLNKTSVASSLSGRTLTISGLPSYHHPQIMGGSPGDVIYDDESSAVFFVRSYNSGTGVILAELQNGYRGASPTAMFTYNTSTGNLYFGIARAYVPSTYTKGTLSTGSSTVSAVGRDDGYGGALTTWIANGDNVFVRDHQFDRSYTRTTAATLISNVTNGSPGSFVLGSAPLKSETRDMGFFIRQPPANV